MSCPDWKTLALDFRRSSGPGPARLAAEAEWELALRHLDGCPSCRREALAADPTLVFRGLPAPELPSAEERTEVEAMRAAVVAMRNASRHGRRDRIAERHLDAPAWGRISRRSLAAGLTAMALLLGGGESLRQGVTQPGGSFPAPASLAGGPASAPSFHFRTPAGFFASSVGAAPAAAHGSIEELRRRPHARVYQIDGPRLSVVMIVDEKLDV
ncbi:MAG TPA: hypothetical protein VHR45_03055 [Thermoanaerobaculia bacterium]|nr:hypothetical protein [Thermoanaerobaculia bacterium]